jgi:DNA polymerase-3 subunit epsilon
MAAGWTDMDKAFAHDDAILQARNVLTERYVIIDTETTGLVEPEVVQYAALTCDDQSQVFFVRPSKPIESGATAIHHITDALILDAPTLDQLWLQIKPLLLTYNIIGYNVQYDLKALRKSAFQCGMLEVVPKQGYFDVMLCYASLIGEIKPEYGSFRWWKLEEAVQVAGIHYEGEAHDARSDVVATWNLLQWIANQKTTWEVALDMAEHVVDKLDADVPGLQEVFHNALAKITYRKA